MEKYDLIGKYCIMESDTNGEKCVHKICGYVEKLDKYIVYEVGQMEMDNVTCYYGRGRQKIETILENFVEPELEYKYKIYQDSYVEFKEEVKTKLKAIGGSISSIKLYVDEDNKPFWEYTVSYYSAGEIVNTYGTFKAEDFCVVKDSVMEGFYKHREKLEREWHNYDESIRKYINSKLKNI